MSTTASRASPPSGSSSTSGSPTSSSGASSPEMESAKIGDPMDEGTRSARWPAPTPSRTIDRQVQETVAAGARLLTGGKPLGGPGSFYAPTVLTDIPDGSPRTARSCSARSRSSCAPATSTTRSASPTTPTFGLGSSAWTTDPAEQERFVNEVEAGMVFINHSPIHAGSRSAASSTPATGGSSPIRPAVVRQHQDRLDRHKRLSHRSTLLQNGRFPAGRSGNPLP